MMSFEVMRSIIMAVQAEILIALIIVSLIEFVLVLVLYRGLRSLNKLLDRLLEGAEPSTFSDVFKRLFEQLGNLRGDVRSLQLSVEELSEKQRRCLQHIGVVRFDAFQDVGGQQSFSLAILDGYGNGAVITSLFGRQECRCFAKPIIGGRSSLRLTDEELEAMRLALSTGTERER